MTKGRRQFLQGTAAAAVAAISSQLLGKVRASAFKPQMGLQNAPFEMLVLGDSVVWGQGLLEEEKFYSIVRNKLASEFLRRSDIRMVVRAHSGATIIPKGNYSPTNFPPRNYGEVPTAAPTLWAQVSMALDFYAEMNVKPERVGLVLVNGGINDIGFPVLVNPFTKEEDVREKARKFCAGEMGDLLKSLAGTFPNALFMVTGYYPIITEGTPENTLMNLLKAFLDSRTREKAERQIREEGVQVTETSKGWLFTKLRNLSVIWKESSDKYLAEAIAEINKNALPNCKRALLAKIHLDVDEGYNAPNMALWNITKDFRTEDQRYAYRNEPKIGVCDPKVNNLSRLDRQICSLAATGHPNLRGVKKYADSIIEQLRVCFPPP